MTLEEDPLKYNLIETVRKTVYCLKSKVGHADGVAVGIDQCNMNSATPVFQYSAGLMGQLPPAIPYSCPVHPAYDVKQYG